MGLGGIGYWYQFGKVLAVWWWCVVAVAYHSWFVPEIGLNTL